MFPVYSIPNLAFCHSVDENGVEYGEFLLETGHLVLTDSPYNFRHVLQDGCSDCEKSSVQDLKAMASLCEEVMYSGLHGHMFCTALLWPLGTSCR